MLKAPRTPAGWTLILWDIENVPVPEQLRDPAGVKQLKELLRERFARARNLQLHCIKLACRWRSPYANLLGWLTTLGDVEALGYQWQGQKDKTHNADRLLKQAADRFMHMLEMHGGPEHLVVFITSDQDFCEKIQELQRRNFKVVVLYHGPSASSKPASITQVADESHDWLTFLKQELGLPLLSFVPYNPQVYRGAHQAQNVGLAARTASTLSRQASQESRHTGRPSSANSSMHNYKPPAPTTSGSQAVRMKVCVARDQDFQDQIGSHQWFDLMDPEKVTSFWVHHETTLLVFKQNLTSQWGIPMRSQRLWLWARCRNGTLRLSEPMDSGYDELHASEIAGKAGQSTGDTQELWLYLEEAKKDKPLVPIAADNILLFFKLYDPKRQTLSYLGRCYAWETNRLPALMPFLRRKAGYTENVALQVAEEIKFEPKVACQVLDKSVTIKQADLLHGDILLVQRVLTEEEAAKLKHPYVKGFLKYVRKLQLAN